MDKAVHLLAMELNLKEGLMKLLVASSVVECKTKAAMQYEMQTESWWKIGILLTSQQTQGRESKKNANKESVKPNGNCARFSSKDSSTVKDGMPKGTIAEQLQKMQDKADVISKLQREL